MVNYAATLNSEQLDKLVEDLSKTVPEGNSAYIIYFCLIRNIY